MAAPKKTMKKESVAKKSSVKKASVKKASVKKKKVSKAQPDNPPEKKVVAKKDSSLLVLNAVMAINEVRTFHEELLMLSESEKTVTLDASKVEAIDTATFQLLVAFVATMNKKNVGVVWHEPSEEFLERVSLLNLTDELYLGGAEG